MKYVGPKHYDANFSLVSGANPNQEWDTSTGVFVANPDAEGQQRRRNHLNKFGRTGTTEGNYKRYDAVGELYYEALRYIQGLPPTASAVSGITAAMKDGFAAYDTWTDPHPAVTGTTDYSCVRNNIVAIRRRQHLERKYFRATRAPARTTRRAVPASPPTSPTSCGGPRWSGRSSPTTPRISYVDGRA